jgi:hypothetical protein
VYERSHFHPSNIKALKDYAIHRLFLKVNLALESTSTTVN